jgi:hypothetical protein
VNGAEAESPVLPVTTIVYTPNRAVDVIVKDPNIEPLVENVHVGGGGTMGSGVVTHG